MDVNDSDEILAETENLIVWRSKDGDAGYIYHLEIGNISLHFVPEEWEELVVVMKSASAS